jgi:hypothetical protein
MFINIVIIYIYISVDTIFQRLGCYQDSLDKELLLTRKLLHQGFLLLIKLKLSLRKFYGRYHNIVHCYGITVSQMTMEMFHL